MLLWCGMCGLSRAEELCCIDKEMHLPESKVLERETGVDERARKAEKRQSELGGSCRLL